MRSAATSVPAQTEQQALVAVASHPLQKEASTWPYCTSDVFEISKHLIDRMHFSAEEKSGIQSALTEVETTLLVSYWTSNRKPEPLAGGGKQYAFLVHPQSFAILHAGVGTWRS
jgi:hypothetical protein